MANKSTLESCRAFPSAARQIAKRIDPGTNGTFAIEYRILRRFLMKMMAMVLSLALALGAGNVYASHIIGVPTAVTASSEFSGSFVVGNLFDATVTDADIGVTLYGNPDQQYAGAGGGPHNVFMDYGSTILSDGFVYSQRLGGNPATDKVTQIEFWFESTDPAGVLPGGLPDTTVAITNTANTLLTQHSLAGTFSGQYVTMRLTGNGGNPGGSELRLLEGVPEPSTFVLAALGLLGLLGFGRRRRK